MKKIFSGKYILIFLILLTAGVSTGFLVSQDTREFRIAKNLEIFFNLFRELNTFYVDEINPDKIIKTGIDNMLKTLDPYTVYMPEEDADEFKIMTTGKYGGIGSLVRSENDFTVVSEVYKGFPADQAGIKAGDVLKKVDGQSLKGLASDKVSERLKGEPGTAIKLTVERNGVESDYSLKREKIAIPSVPYYGMIDQKTGYIRFTNFTQNCIEEVRNALVSLKKNNPDQIILDLRGNPGGLLSEAVEIVNLFVGPGNEVVSTKGKIKQSNEVFKTSRAAVDEKIPLAVVVNQGSASASEIVAGAIQDLDRGVIIGQRSYGKGLVQITRPLNYNTQLKVTTAKYYIPSGRCIQAIDFSHRNEDGSVGYVPDSLIHEFKTRHGRTVKDGGGIAPDVEIQSETLSQLTAELYLRNFIFDFATKYYWSHQEIKSIDQFSFTEKDFADFNNYINSKNFNYKTETEDSFNELVKTAKKEKYYEIHKDAFSALEKEITHSLDNDLALFRPEITNLIEDEILSRYFYQEGALAWSVKNDVQIQRALQVLSNKDLYTSILQGKSGALMVTKNNLAPISGTEYVNKMTALKSTLLSSAKRG
jgi:carboxyl-terminal processing protease